MINKKTFYIVLTVWVVLWLHFMMRELFLKGSIYDYKILLGRDLDGKRSYITGDRLYEFIVFSGRIIPAGATADFIGVEEDSVDRVRAAYYLFPVLIQKGANYMLVYDPPQAGVIRNYEPFAKLDDSRYVLKRKD